MLKSDFIDKVILITGSSQGIGKTLALTLGKQGAIIGLNGRDSKKLKAVHDEFLNIGIRSLPLAGDITSYPDCENITERLIKEFGRIDVLVTNASVMVEASIMDVNPDVLKMAIESQAIGSAFPIKATLPHLVKSGGYILIVSSLAAFHASPRYTTYSMGKATQALLAQGLRFELKESEVDIGIAYVCFTKNENGKKLIKKDGSLSSMPPRPGKMQFSREKVSAGMANMIKNRSREKTFSFYGKAYKIASKICPWMIRIFIRRSLRTNTIYCDS